MNAQALTQDKVESTRLAEVPYLGAIIATDERDTEALAAHLHAVSTDDLAFPEHRVIHRAMIHLHQERGAVEIGALIDHLRRSGRLEEAGGVTYLMELMDAIPTAASLESYTREVREVAQRRRQAEVLEQCASLARETSVSPTELRRVVAAGMEKVTPESVTASSPWSDAPRLPGPPDPDPLPLDSLPPVLLDIATTAHVSVQVAPCMPMGLALAAVSAAVADRVVVRPDDAWTREHIPLYVVEVAPPAERKSALYAILTPPLREWEENRAREVAPRRRLAQAIVEARGKALQRAQQAGNDDEVEVAVLALQEAEGDLPTIPRLLAQDATPEALVRQMGEQGGRAAVLSPEGGPLRILDGRYSDGVARLEELASAYDGEEIRVDRVGRPSIYVARPILTLGVMVQPSVLQAVQNGRSLRGQGIYGRISWIVPRSRVGSRVDSSEAPPLEADAVARYGAMLHRLLDWKPRGYTPEGTPIPHELRLSPQASALKREYHVEVEAGLRPGEPLAGIPDWAGKTVGRAIRIATLLELAARADEGRPLTEPISEWAMESAIRICRALTTHALFVYGEMDMDREQALLWDVWRRARDLPDGSSLRDLYMATRGLASIKTMDDLRPHISDLVERGCIRLVHHPSTGGRPPSEGIQINPTLRTDPRNSRKSPTDDDSDWTSATSAQVYVSDPLTEALVHA